MTNGNRRLPPPNYTSPLLRKFEDGEDSGQLWGWVIDASVMNFPYPVSIAARKSPM